MGEVVSVPQWGRTTNTVNVASKFVSCDEFIRSKVLPPPIGSIVFNFAGGKVTITGNLTHIMGGECEITIRGGYVCINGSHECAVEVFCSIHREIEEIQSRSGCAEVVARGFEDAEHLDIEDNTLRGLIG